MMKLIFFNLFFLSNIFSWVVFASPEKICAVGDAGSGNLHQFAVGRAMATYGCTHILYLGDNFYGHGVSSTTDNQWDTKFRQPYRSLLEAGAQFFVTLGNHDYLGDPQAQIDYSRQFPQWILPSNYYSTGIAPACIISIDTNRPDAVQAQWLNQVLNFARCTWKIVIGHHPIVSSGFHGAGAPAIDAILRPALAGADLLLSGHDHNFADEGLVSVDPSRPGSPRFRQVIVGTGGAQMRPVFCRTADCRYTNFTHGFGAIDFSAVLHNGKTTDLLTIKFYDENLRQRYATTLEK